MLTIIYWLAGIALTLILISTVTSLLYYNPYQLTIFMGNMGVGKSSMVAKLCIKYLKKGRTVYCNCDDIKLNGVRVFSTKDIGKYSMHDAIVIIDEASLYFDNRNFKETSKEFIQWLRSIRHNRLVVYVLSQNYDMDLKIRRAATGIYLGTKFFSCFTIWRKLKKNIAIKTNAMNAETSIVDELKFVPIWNLSAIKCIFLPRYFRYFESFKALTETKPIEYVEVSGGIEKRPLGRLKKG